MSATHPSHASHPHAPNAVAVPTAADIMRRSLVTLTPEMPIFDAIRLLLRHGISGAPVVDAEGHLVGICSELDCLRILASGEFYEDDHREEGHVADYMSTGFTSVAPHTDIYSLAQIFLSRSLRRLPVMDGDRLLGQLSRRDVLRAMEELGARRAKKRKYPDYREPSGDVGPRRAS